MSEYVIIYKQSCGAKYGCITTSAENGNEAKEYIFAHYGYLVNENNFVKVVKVGIWNYKD